MYVHGFEITDEQQNACEQAMKKRFRASDIELVAIQAGVPKYKDRNGIAHRVADRIIQRKRKAGEIIRDGKHWLPILEFDIQEMADDIRAMITNRISVMATPISVSTQDKLLDVASGLEVVANTSPINFASLLKKYITTLTQILANGE